MSSVGSPGSRVEDRIEHLWPGGFEAEAGVVQVAAIGRDTGGAAAVIRIGDGAPRSASDLFALGVARARSDAIVTTGRILRSEPGLRYDLPADLRRWRERHLGKKEPPQLVLLTRSLDVPWAHPALAGRPPLVVTSEGGETPGSGAPTGLEVLSSSEGGLRAVLPVLRNRGLRDLCIEAGPSTARPLYETPVLVEELMLSVFEEKSLGADLVAGAFPDPDACARLFGPARSEVASEEESGRWRFLRFRREI